MATMAGRQAGSELGQTADSTSLRWYGSFGRFVGLLVHFFATKKRERNERHSAEVQELMKS